MDEPLLVKSLKKAFPHRFLVAKLSRTPILVEAFKRFRLIGLTGSYGCSRKFLTYH